MRNERNSAGEETLCVTVLLRSADGRVGLGYEKYRITVTFHSALQTFQQSTVTIVKKK